MKPKDKDFIYGLGLGVIYGSMGMLALDRVMWGMFELDTQQRSDIIIWVFFIMIASFLYYMHKIAK